MRRLFAAGGDGLAFLELGILDHLQRAGPTSPGALSTGEDVSGPAIAAALRHLEALGLAGRSKARDDGRRIVVTLTDAGRRALDDRDAAILRRLHEVVRDRLDPAERAQLAAVIPLLEKVAGEL